MTKILISGANSFVGKNIQSYSKHKDTKEICLIKNKPEDIVFEGVDVVIHLAAIVHQSDKIPDSKYFEINRDLCINVAQHAKNAKVKQFIFISSIKVYGEYNQDLGAWNENTICRPDDAYGKSKYEAELLLKQLEDSEFTVSIIRPPLIYGKGVKANMLNLIKLVDKISFLPFANTTNKRCYANIENLIELIDIIIDKKASGVFIALDDNPLSTEELVQIIARCLNKKIYLFPLPGFVIKVGIRLIPKIFDRLYGSFEIDNICTKQKLNFKPVISTEEGIQKMVNAYLAEKTATISETIIL